MHIQMLSDGERVRLRNAARPNFPGAHTTLYVHHVKNAVVFERRAGQVGSLRVGADGGVSMKGGRGQWAQFRVSRVSDTSELVTLANVGNAARSWLLAVDDRDQLVGTCVDAMDPHAHWEIQRLGLASESCALRDGQFVRFQHALSGDVPPHVFKVHTNGKGYHIFEVANKTQTARGTLRILDQGQVDLNGHKGIYAQWTVLPTADGRFMTMYNKANEGKTNVDGTLHWYLGRDPKRNMISGMCSDGPDGQWLVTEVTQADVPASTFTAEEAPAPRWFDEATLSDAQKAFFRSNGYLQVSQVVNRALVDAALRTINHHLARPDGGVEMPTDDAGARLRGGAQNSREVVALLMQSPAWTLAQRLIGRDRIKPESGRGGQIALIAPELNPNEASGAVLPANRWHIDGLEKGKHTPFTLLVGIALSPVRTEFAGNFVVFPGSHVTLQETVRRAVAEENDPTHASEGLLTVTPGLRESRPSVGEPLQLLAEPGDVVFAHPKLAHRGGPNHSPHTRYQIYFRLRHVAHHSNMSMVLDDLWLEYEGLRV